MRLSQRDFLLDALTVASGAVDAISFLAIGKVFAAFMTGNVVFLGMRMAGASAPDGGSVLAAIIGFSVGVYLAARLAPPSSSADTWPKGVTLALAVSLVWHAVFVAIWIAAGGTPNIHAEQGLLAIWGLAMGMQTAAIRALRVESVYTKWPAARAQGYRLTRVLLSLLVGAAAGGLLVFHALTLAPVLPLVITAAVVAAAAISTREPSAR